MILGSCFVIYARAKAVKIHCLLLVADRQVPIFALSSINLSWSSFNRSFTSFNLSWSSCNMAWSCLHQAWSSSNLVLASSNWTLSSLNLKTSSHVRFKLDNRQISMNNYLSWLSRWRLKTEDVRFGWWRIANWIWKSLLREAWKVGGSRALVLINGLPQYVM